MQWERRVSLAKPGSLACLEKGAPRDPKENGERRARLALPVLPGPLDPKGPLEMTAPKAAL